MGFSILGRVHRHGNACSADRREPSGGLTIAFVLTDGNNPVRSGFVPLRTFLGTEPRRRCELMLILALC